MKFMPTPSAPSSTWSRLPNSPTAATPFPHTTCVSIHCQLLTIGGKDSERKPATTIHMYNPTTDSWEVISHTITPRYDCIAAVLPNNQLMIVGGFNIVGDETSESVELATIHE